MIHTLSLHDALPICGLIIIEHTVSGQALRTAYAHMWQHGIHVTPGQTVTAGTHIGDVGSSGRSTGAHLHFEVRPGSTGSDTIDADAWLAEHGATETDGGSTAGPGCAPGTDAPAPAGMTGDPDAMVEDPTSSGQITTDRQSTRLNSSHVTIAYAVLCLKT